MDGAGGRVAILIHSEFTETALAEREAAIREELLVQLETGEWKTTFRGRDILARFADRHANTSYEAFRDSVLARMKDGGYRPVGMAAVLEAIIADPFPL